MMMRFAPENLRHRVTDPTVDGLWLREQLMPRWGNGGASRPIAPPPDAPPARIGAVLVLLYPVDGAVYLPLTVRTASLRTHSGEISLPGGGADSSDADLAATALREAWEELGVPPEAVTLWGALTQVWIPVSNFQITPFVGWAAQRPALVPAPDEVAELVEAPLELLLDPNTIRSEYRERRGDQMYIPYFAVGEHKVWGATSLVLAEMVGKLRA